VGGEARRVDEQRRLCRLPRSPRVCVGGYRSEPQTEPGHLQVSVVGESSDLPLTAREGRLGVLQRDCEHTRACGRRGQVSGDLTTLDRSAALELDVVLDVFVSHIEPLWNRLMRPSASTPSEYASRAPERDVGVRRRTRSNHFLRLGLDEPLWSRGVPLALRAPSLLTEAEPRQVVQRARQPMPVDAGRSWLGPERREPCLLGDIFGSARVRD